MTQMMRRPRTSPGAAFLRTGRQHGIFHVRRKGNYMFCNSCNNNSALWIVLILIIIFGFGWGNGGCGCGCGCDNNNNGGCGCGC